MGGEYGTADDLSISFGEAEVFLDTDAEPDKGFSLTPAQAEKLARELLAAARDARTFKYGN